MARKVIIGGFGSCKRQMESVAYDLSAYYDEDIESLSFREANADSNRLDRMTKGARVLTHSAGMLAIRHTQPVAIDAIAPPLPASPRALVKRALASGYDFMAAPAATTERRNRVAECGRNITMELMTHLHANLGKIGLIATFNAIESGIAAQAAGIDVGLAFMDKDRFFNPDEEYVAAADEACLPIVLLGGGHEEFLCDPTGLMAEYEALRGGITLERANLVS